MTPANIALIPAYEPDQTLTGLVEDLSGAGFTVVLVDDGSGPDYHEIFKDAARNAAVLTHFKNRGKGQALKTALSYIVENFDEDSVIVTVDADGQHSVEDAVNLSGIAREHPDTLILGSRSFKGDIPLRSRFGNAATRLVYRLTTGLSVHDTQTGLRAFHMDLVPRMLDICGARYEYEMNVLLTFARNRIPILEEPIETIYLGSNESSHFDALKDSARVCKEILKFSASSLAGFAVDYALFSLLLLATGSLIASNVIARLVSSSVNFTLNRKFVFKSSSGLLKSAASYFLLAAGILAGNTLVLSFLANTLGVNRLAAKFMTEIGFFIFSWFIQKFIIFRKNETLRKGVCVNYA